MIQPIHRLVRLFKQRVRKILHLDSPSPLPFPRDQREASFYSEIWASGYFDESWYRLAYGDSLEIKKDALADYVRAGIGNGRDPSPYFNTVLYRREHDVSIEEALLDFLRSEQTMTGGAYRNERALIIARQAFQTRTQTSLVADRRLDSRPFAVFLQCGADSLWADWCSEENQPWHLLINHYDNTYAGRIPCDVEFDQTGELAGTKCTAFYSLLEKYPDILAPYQYVALLDDDIQFQPGDLTRLFTIVQSHGWEMAQASLSPDSYCSYRVFFNAGTRWRRVNGVEVMMPVYSQCTLSVVKELIGQSVSGWGFDTALAIVAARQGWHAAIVDEVIAQHNKPINADIGKYYQMLHRESIYPEIEFTHLQKEFGFTQPLFHEQRA